MDNSDTEETIRLIRDSAQALVPADGGLKRVRAQRFQLPGFDRDAWGTIQEMGWLGLCAPEDEGGSGLGLSAYVALAECLGGGLVPEPLIGGVLAARAATDLLQGSRVVLAAWQAHPNVLDPAGGVTIKNGRLSGRKILIPMAAGADAFLVSVPGGAAMVKKDAPGVSLSTDLTQDGGHYGALTLENVACEMIPIEIGTALEEATLATAGYLLGLMERAFAMTLDYLNTREQFGRKVGSFQALHHRAVDLKIQIALTRASVEDAARKIDAGADPQSRKALVSRAKARAADAAMLVTREAIQLHGGIGYTDEADIGLFLRKAMVSANLYGSARLHRARYAALTPEDNDD